MTKGYKVFKNNMTCRGFQFEIGETYEEEEAVLCEKGFHFHENPKDLFNYYDYPNIVCEVECEGVVTGDDKSVCKKIRIVRMLDGYEVLELVNSGKNNTGIKNSGNYNSGSRNSGSYNSGYRNSGNCNPGSYNSGNHNSGNCNPGSYNSGNHNSGNHNSGNCNSGSHNSGDNNSGNHNSGHRNSGNNNSGNYNSGSHNSGDNNSGNHNSGHRNSGNNNSGNYNSGNYNSGNHNSGFFNTDEPTVRMFGKDTGLKRSEIKIPYIRLPITYYIEDSDLPDEEKTGYGILKTRTYKEAWKIWWGENPERHKEFTSLPCFDAEKFEEITGICVERS